MKIFNVTVRTITQRFTYTAIGSCSADIVCAAYDRFDDLRSVVVTPSREA